MSFPFRRILSPVDFDGNSFAALEVAAQLARQNDGTVLPFHVVPNRTESDRTCPTLFPQANMSTRRTSRCTSILPIVRRSRCAMGSLARVSLLPVSQLVSAAS